MSLTLTAGDLTIHRLIEQSLRAKRSNPGRHHSALDCFASLAMTAKVAMRLEG